MILRPYQIEAVDAIRGHMRAGKRAVVLTLATGGGKTLVACEVIRAATGKSKRSLVLAHRRELIAQTSAKLTEAGVPHGLIQAGVPETPAALVQVASRDTIIRREHWALADFDLVILDECHSWAKDNTNDRILSWFPRARIIGLTATPWRLDGAPLEDLFDAQVLATTPLAMRDAGYLVPVKGWRYKAIDTAGLKTQAGDFSASEVEPRAIKINGSVVAEWCAHARGLRTMVYAITVAHAESLCADFNIAGARAMTITGETDTGIRDAAVKALRAHELDVICNVGCFTEGTDIPELGCIVLAFSTMSTTKAVQVMGRVLRPAAGKTAGRIHDHGGIILAHGGPYCERDYSLQGGAHVTRKAVDRATSETQGEEFQPRKIEENEHAQRKAIDERDEAQRKVKAARFQGLWASRNDGFKRAAWARLKASRPFKQAWAMYCAMSGGEKPRKEWMA